MEIGPFWESFGSLALVVGTFVQMVVSLRGLRNTEAAKDFLAFDEWRNEYKWWQLWHTTKRRDHMRAFRGLKKSEPAAYFRYTQVLWNICGWVLVFFGALMVFIASVL